MKDRNKMAFGMRGDRAQQSNAARRLALERRIEELEALSLSRPIEPLRFAGIPTGSSPIDGGPIIAARDLRVDGRLHLEALTLEADARLLVTGANGAGKSTLLSLLAGDFAADAGTTQRRKGLRIALLEQDVRWPDPSRSPFDLYERSVGEARAAALPLADLGLIHTRDEHRPVGALSVGQQRRVALALIIARPPHLFLLDEPTNHLSLSLATELENALGSYPGAVVVASHDRWLRRRWAGRTLHLEAAG
jgi:macrolide transport system ATP-binding/permease protein